MLSIIRNSSKFILKYLLWQSFIYAQISLTANDYRFEFSRWITELCHNTEPNPGQMNAQWQQYNIKLVGLTIFLSLCLYPDKAYSMYLFWWKLIHLFRLPSILKFRLSLFITLYISRGPDWHFSLFIIFTSSEVHWKYKMPLISTSNADPSCLWVLSMAIAGCKEEMEASRWMRS